MTTQPTENAPIQQQPADEQPRPMTPWGLALKARLKEMGKSKEWLVDEINRRREAEGRPDRTGSATIWRWQVGLTTMNVDDAALIELICGVPAILASRYADALAAEEQPSDQPPALPVA